MFYYSETLKSHKYKKDILTVF